MTKEIIEIKQNNSDFDKYKLLANCISNDALRPALCGIYSTGKKVMATDSTRGVIFENLDLPQGFYSVVKNVKTIIQLEKIEYNYEYPGLEKIINDAVENKRNKVELNKEYNKAVDGQVDWVEGSFYLNVSKVIKNLKDGAFINIDYLKEILFSRLFKYHYSDTSGVNLFMGDGVNCIIMSIQSK